MTLLTVQETAAQLRMSVSHLQHEAAARRIGFIKLGKRSYFSEADIQRYLESRRVEPVEA